MKTILKGVKVEEIERAYEKTLSWFYAFPRRTMGLSELAVSIKSSKTATKKAVTALVQKKFIFQENVGRAWILSANPKHPYFKTKKIPYHLGKIYESGILEAIHKHFPQTRAVILFGSYRWGDDIEESDIDLAIEVLDGKELQIVHLGNVENIGYRKNIPVNVHIFSRNKIDLNLFANIANGIVLEGFLEVRP